MIKAKERLPGSQSKRETGCSVKRFIQRLGTFRRAGVVMQGGLPPPQSFKILRNTSDIQ